MQAEERVARRWWNALQLALVLINVFTSCPVASVLVVTWCRRALGLGRG